MQFLYLVLVFFLVICCKYTSSISQFTECEVCIDVLSEVMKKITEQKINGNPDKELIRKALLEHCKAISNSNKEKDKKMLPKGDDMKKEKLCSYIGAHEDSAASALNDIIQPMAFYKPPEKICRAVKDAQVCDLKYDKPIEWDSLDLETMKVKQLKELLSKLGDNCKGCTEKRDYITRINELKPKTKPTEL